MASRSCCQWMWVFIALLLSTVCAVDEVDNDNKSAIEQARLLQTPVPNATDGAEFEAAEFFDQHADLLHQAWNEFEDQLSTLLPIPMEDILDPTLHRALQQAWSAAAQKDMTGLEESEAFLMNLWEPVAPDVWAATVLQPKGIEHLRKYLNLATSAGIPLRRPNGMNRYGVIVDSNVAGAVPLKGLTSVIQNALIDHCFRPVGRMLLPHYTSYNDKDNDANGFAFTIRYQSEEDLYLREHSDASLVTMNINLNLPNETYTGSDLYFVDPVAQQQQEEGREARHTVSMKPGMALIHRGLIRHAALPLRNGTRTNLILWLFGADDGYVRVAPYEAHEQMTALQRWSSKPMESSSSSPSTPKKWNSTEESFDSWLPDAEEL